MEHARIQIATQKEQLNDYTKHQKEKFTAKKLYEANVVAKKQQEEKFRLEEAEKEAEWQELWGRKGVEECQFSEEQGNNLKIHLSKILIRKPALLYN